MKRFNSPAIIAIILALFIYLGVIGAMYVVSVRRGHELVRERTLGLMRSVTLNIQEILYVMGETTSSYLSAYGTIERTQSGYTRLMLTDREMQNMNQEKISRSLKDFVESNPYAVGAFFYFEHDVYGLSGAHPYSHRGYEEVMDVDDYFNFNKSKLYAKVQQQHYNWWHTLHHKTVFGEPIMTCCTPIYLNDTTQFLGVFCMDYPLDSLNSFLRLIKPYEEAEMFIINSSGYVIAQTDSLYFGVLKQDLPLWESKGIGNAEMSFSNLPWTLRMYTPKAVVQETLVGFLDAFLIYGVVGLVLLTLCLLVAVRAILKSLKERGIIENELKMAGSIQRSLLPPSLPQCDGVSISAMLRPAKEVAGDVYEVQHISHYIYFMIGDVSGKGVQASMLMAMLNGLFRHEVRRSNLPYEIMMQLNNSFVERNPEMLFCTMLIGRLDCRNGELYLCNAGQNCPVFHGKLLPLKANMALGIVPDYPYTDELIRLNNGDVILCYTDGVTEAMNKHHKLFGEERLVALPPVISEIMHAIDTYVKNAKQNDDITMLSLEYTPFVLHSIDDIAQLREFLKTQYALNDKQLSKVQLVVEEMVVNALTHGGASWVSVRAEVNADTIKVKVMDDGVDFDPTTYECVPCKNGDELTVGGQGILLARQCSRQITHMREDDCNHLAIVLEI